LPPLYELHEFIYHFSPKEEKQAEKKVWKMDFLGSVLLTALQTTGVRYKNLVLCFSLISVPFLHPVNSEIRVCVCKFSIHFVCNGGLG
jgi:hypothetical protein